MRTNAVDVRDVKLRITCYYCDSRVAVSFADAGDRERLYKALDEHGWMLGVGGTPDIGVVFDAICHGCGREVFRNMICSAHAEDITPEARAAIRRHYPDLLEGTEN